MSAQVMISSRAYQSALPPRRRVQCACAPDFGKRPLLESKVLDVTEPAPFSVPSTYTEADILFPPETKHADEWLGSSPLVSVQSTGGTTFAELESTVPLAPTVPDDEAKKEGLGAYLMQSAPVRAYMHQLETSPFTTKCWTSFTGFFLGDVAAQLLTEPDFVISRTLILAGYGFFIDAPAGNAFYLSLPAPNKPRTVQTWMDKTIHPDEPKTAKAVGKKIAIDQLIYAPIFTCILYIFLTTSHLDMESIPAVLDAKVIPTLMANWCVWPLAHGLNFYFVPTEQRILYNNFVAVCWTTWLSYIAN